MRTWQEKRTAAIEISKRYAEDQMRKTPGNTPAVHKAREENNRQIVMNIEAHHVTRPDYGERWKENSMWKNKKEAEDWTIASLTQWPR